MSDEPADGVTTGPGYSVSALDLLGEGYGFRKIRTPMGLTAFGANAIVLPPDYTSKKHFHEEQEELYFVHAGLIEISFDDGTTHLLGPGGLAWAAPHTVRQLKNVGEGPAVYVAIGGKDGYVPRDGRPGDSA